MWANLLGVLTTLVLAAAVWTRSPLIQTPRPVKIKLFEAIWKNNVAVVRSSLRAGANPNSRYDGMSPLQSLSLLNLANSLTIAKLLVAKGARLNAPIINGGKTPLMIACDGSGDSMVDYFLKKGAQVNTATLDGTTALHIAVQARALACVRLLLSHGATLTPRTKDVPKAEAPLFSSLGELQDSKIEDGGYLIRTENPAYIAAEYEPGFRFSGTTPLMGFGLFERVNFDAWDRAEKRGDPRPNRTAMIDLLIKAGTKIKDRDDSGWTALHYAAKGNLDEAIVLLVGHGADVNAASKAGYRPLHVAARARFEIPQPAVVQALLNRGANPDLKNSAGQTPADLLRADAAAYLKSVRAAGASYKRSSTEESWLDLVNATLQLLDPEGPPIDPVTLSTSSSARSSL